MANKKKATMKEMEERLNVIAYNLNHIKMTVDNIGFALSRYIDFKGDAAEFKKDLEKTKNVDKLKEEAQDTLKNEAK
tara:strand:+ start:398 stop:628 length:231 start_codon:yes stop_codon:yes gene_type:complete